jgi:hypothetical protein
MTIPTLFVYEIVLPFKYFRALPISCLDGNRSLFTNSMQQNRFWEANFFSADQQMPWILRNLDVYCRFHTSSPGGSTLGPAPSQSTPHWTFISLRSSLLLFSYLCLSFTRSLFPSSFKTKLLCKYFISHSSQRPHLPNPSWIWPI